MPSPARSRSRAGTTITGAVRVAIRSPSLTETASDACTPGSSSPAAVIAAAARCRRFAKPSPSIVHVKARPPRTARPIAIGGSRVHAAFAARRDGRRRWNDR